MSLPVLLSLSLLTVRCGGCDLDWEVVRNVKATVDANPTGFRTAFPKNYYVSHGYTNSMLCDSDPCCVFPAAVVLRESWNVLLSNLWDEHLNRSLVFDLKHTLERIIRRNKNTERFQEEMDPARLSQLLSSPEELLKLTSEVFQRWLEVGCSPSIQECDVPTLPPPVEKALPRPARARLLTTRAVSGGAEEGERALAMGGTPPRSAAPCVLAAPARGLLLLGLCCWWLSP